MVQSNMAFGRDALSSLCGLAVLIGGCPRRQTSPRVVYVPSPPPASRTTAAQGTETLVIEEPPPPSEPSETPTERPPTPRPAHRPRHVIRTVPQADTVEVTPEPVEPPTVEVPALEPRESHDQEAGLRREIQGLRAAVQQRIAQLERAKLSIAQGKTLEDARAFLAQSGKALEEGDLQRSLNLAQKASLLVSALEQQP